MVKYIAYSKCPNPTIKNRGHSFKILIVVKTSKLWIYL